MSAGEVAAIAQPLIPFDVPESRYGIWCVICPGMATVMTPAQRHINWQVLSSAGMLPTITVGTPGTQGDGVFGMHGIGVSTPSAAAVAAATIGLAGLMHTPNGMMLSIGTWSMMLAAGWLPVITRLMGRTVSTLGAAPIAHISWAVLQTC